MQDPTAQLHRQVLAALRQVIPDLPARVGEQVSTAVPNGAAHGDLTTNAALVGAPAAGRSAVAVARAVADLLSQLAEIDRAEAVRPGFVNLHLSPSVFQATLRSILRQGRAAAGAGFGSARGTTGGDPGLAATVAELRQARACDRGSMAAGFRVQHAYARCCSVLRHATATLDGFREADLADAVLEGVPTWPERALLRRLLIWPGLEEDAARTGHLQRIVNFLYDLADDFDMLWHHGSGDLTMRFIQAQPPQWHHARLAPVAATAVVIRSGLATLGVDPVEELV